MDYNYKDIAIVFYKEDDETFKAGNIVQGHVEFNFETAKEVKRINIHIVGECNTKCLKTENNNEEKVEYTGNCNIFHDQLVIVKSPRKIPAGFYKQEFIFRLPKDTPGTYFSDNGSISYHIKMVIELQKSSRCEGAIFPFTVSPSPIDLRYRNDLFEKRWIAVNKKFSTIFSCNKVREINITANIAKTGYKPGDTIPVRVEVDNWSKIAVNAVKVTLFRKQTFSFDRPNKDTETKMEFLSLTQTKSVKKFSCEWFDLDLVVPSNIVLRDFSKNGLIEEEFVLLVKASLDGPYFDMEGEIPIELGDFA